jgi:ubiquinone/menaquinone biosynthesis C-methylase UbiE
MTEKTSKPHADYIPAMGKHFLLPLYDVVHHVFGLAPIHQEMITLAALQDGHRVLDVGCGTGNLLRSLGKRYRTVDLTGLDPDPKALARAARKTRRAGLNIRLDEGFAQALPYPDASFDRVFSSLMLHHLDNESKNALLAEIRRVLRPNGQLVLADMMAEEHGHGRSRMHENIGDAVSQRIAEAGFTVDPTRTMPLRTAGKIGIELARPTKD